MLRASDVIEKPVLLSFNVVRFRQDLRRIKGFLFFAVTLFIRCAPYVLAKLLETCRNNASTDRGDGQNGLNL